MRIEPEMRILRVEAEPRCHSEKNGSQVSGISCSVLHRRFSAELKDS